MNPTQLAALKAAILAETAPAVVAARDAGDHVALANYYAANSTVIVWKSSVAKAEVLEMIAYNDLIGLTADQRTVLSIYLQGEDVPCDRARVRNAFASLFGATGTATRLLALWKRAANRAEALSATGGNGDDATPHNLRYAGVPDSALVGAALRS